MTLRKKTILAIGMVLVALISIQFIASKTILQKGYGNLEKSHVQNDINQVQEALSNEIMYFWNKILDYSSWDDTYKFINDKNNRYIESNLVDATFKGLNINFIAFVDSSGKIVYCMGYDQVKDVQIPVSDEIVKEILNNRFFLSTEKSGSDSGVKGIVMLQQNPIMVVSRPILNSNGGGPERGTVIVGRFLDSLEIKHIDDVTRQKVEIARIYDKNMTKDMTEAWNQLSKPSLFFIKAKNKNTIFGYKGIRDVYNKMSLILRIEQPRDIYKQGQQSILFFTISLIITGSVIILMIILLLERMVLARISFLSSGVSDIGNNRDLSVRILAKGKDELSNLAKEVNIMLEELEKAGNELRESEYSYRHLFESMIDGFAYFSVKHDPDGQNFDFTFLQLNDAFKKIIGIEEDVKGKKISEISGSIGDTLNSIEIHGKYVLTGEKFNYLYFSEFSSRWYMVTAYSADKGFYVTIFHDITERKHNEEELQRAKEAAEYANQAKSQFLATMSHEIRTPMNAILGMSELLIDANLDAKQKDLVSTIHSSGSLLLNIINDVLDFSKIEANKLILNNYEFEVLKVVEDVAEFMAAKAREKGISLMTFVSPEIPLVRGDAERLKQIILNLIGNAIKFTDEGEIVIRAVIEYTDAKQIILLFEVKDTGIGIPEDVQKKLFQPFVQADGSTTRKYGGTGLGLSITKRLVNLMNGEIGIISDAGQGSSFVFNVRFEIADNKIESPNNTASEISDLHVLILNDSKMGIDIIQSYVASWSIRNDCVTGVDDAFNNLVKKAEENDPYDLLILNFVSDTHESAFELALKVRANPLISKTRMILVTVADARIYGEKAINAGFSAFLVKPVKQSQLMDCIANVFDKQIGNTIKEQSLGKDEYAILRENNSSSDVILMVEDNPVNQKLAGMQLEKLGVSVEIANNGQEAVDLLRINRYKLILMDCQMPVMDGFEATSQIRKLEAVMGTRNIIIAMTANAMQGDYDRCMASGMDDYISKPVKMQNLRDMLQKWGALGLKPSETDTNN